MFVLAQGESVSARVSDGHPDDVREKRREIIPARVSKKWRAWKPSRTNSEAQIFVRPAPEAATEFLQDNQKTSKNIRNPRSSRACDR